MDLISGPVDQTSSPQAKIALFRSLFRGRDDVYPRRFESRKTGKSGYAPACANEWVRGICEKPRIKCAECPNRRFLPVTDDVIRWHLSGCDAEGQPFVAGVYPLLQDETCFFLAVDFDKAGWRDDAAAFLDSLSPPESPSRARTITLRARRACLVLLRRSHSSRACPTTGIACPHRDDGEASGHRSGFVRPAVSESGHDAARRIRKPDCSAAPEGRAQTGQHASFSMAPLSHGPTSGRFSRAFARSDERRSKRIVEDAERRGRILGVRLPPQDDGEAEPWTAPAVTSEERLRSSGICQRRWNSSLAIRSTSPSKDLHPGLRNRLLRLAAFQNPEFYKAQAMRLSTYDKPRVVACAEDLPHHIGLPRGCLDDVRKDAHRAWRSHGHSRRTPRRQPFGCEVSGRAAAGTEGRS